MAYRRDTFQLFSLIVVLSIIFTMIAIVAHRAFVIHVIDVIAPYRLSHLTDVTQATITTEYSAGLFHDRYCINVLSPITFTFCMDMSPIFTILAILALLLVIAIASYLALRKKKQTNIVITNTPDTVVHDV